MQIDILTLFPKMFESALRESILKRAQDKGALKVKIHNLRDWTSDSHRSADDKPFGGGPGMVMKVEPVYRALEELKTVKKGARVILLTPQGRKLDQKLVKRLSKETHLVLICGHY
ncbi:MAG: tRNA (guanosine(37)-N1)-methyltransferase TrmD, partial [Candidatus Omnitrophota bacterium]|nr:tRNA (guanosine(37)-N1)-methyltransferase TrmD [Candidatus Omnitrophota bacterium]